MKNKLTILASALLIVALFSMTASASIVQLCYTNSHGNTGCCWATGSCANINCPPHWTCADAGIIGTPTFTKKGDGVTMTVNGVTLPLAGEEFLRKFKQLSDELAEGKGNKTEIEKKLADLWTDPEDWKVSDKLLEKYKKEFSGGSTGGSTGD
ncbi:MAG TPA: hypothetical protein VGM92_04215 [Candidatus Kapabacteria bacterium]|jgi:hypothetical protein